ncbi:MAG: hypothetical protein OXG18_09445 [Gemmatimonadetes bacterium]|nr:hypothetical protein [Gemmatimonadota bacterium]
MRLTGVETLRPGGDDLRCTSCGGAQRARDLDRMLWCDGCVALARARARRIGLLSGVVVAAGLASWIYLVQRPSAMLIGGWIGAVLATLWLVARAATELSYGVLRARRRSGSSWSIRAAPGRSRHSR